MVPTTDQVDALALALHRKLINIGKEIRVARSNKLLLTELKSTRKLIDQTYSKVKYLNINCLTLSEDELTSQYQQYLTIFKNH